MLKRHNHLGRIYAHRAQLSCVCIIAGCKKTMNQLSHNCQSEVKASRLSYDHHHMMKLHRIKSLVYLNYLFYTAGSATTKAVVHWEGKKPRMGRWVTVHPVLNQWLPTCVLRMKINLFAQVLISHREGFCQRCSGEWPWHGLHPFGSRQINAKTTPPFRLIVFITVCCPDTWGILQGDKPESTGHDGSQSCWWEWKLCSPPCQ